MNNFKDIAELESTFILGELTRMPDQLTLGEELFNRVGGSCSLYNLYEHKHPVMLYRSDENRIGFIWENEHCKTRAACVVLLPIVAPIEEAVEQSLDVNHKPTVISDESDVVLVGFNDNQPIKARVDTGAAQCSLHGEDVKWSTDNNLIQFTFEGKRYRMNLNSEQSISSSDGGNSKRPVVAFKVKFAGKLFDKILFNINDRGHMPHPILIGQNILEHGNFLIDPKGDKKSDEVTPEVTKESLTFEDEVQMIREHFLVLTQPIES